MTLLNELFCKDIVRVYLQLNILLFFNKKLQKLASFLPAESGEPEPEKCKIVQNKFDFPLILFPKSYNFRARARARARVFAHHFPQVKLMQIRDVSLKILVFL